MRWLGVTVALLTLAVWLGRIRLLTDPETADVASWIRIGGSLAIGLAAAAVLLADVAPRPRRLVAFAFAAWTDVLWLRALLVVWTDDRTLAFQLAHTVLAAAFLVTATAVAWIVRAPATQ